MNEIIRYLMPIVIPPTIAFVLGLKLGKMLQKQDDKASIQNAYPRILEGQALQQIPLPEEFLPDVQKQQK